MSNPPDLANRVISAANESQLIQTVSRISQDGGLDWALGEVPTRQLTADEIAQLERLGNSAEDWSRVEVADPFNAASIRNCCFLGRVVVGSFTSSLKLDDRVTIPSGLANSTLMQCVVGHHAAVRDVKLLAGYLVGSGAALINCGSICCDGPTSFANGIELPIGVETGGREVAVFAEIDVAMAERVSRARAEDPDALAAYQRAVADYAERARSSVGLIAESAIVRDTSQIRNSFIGPYARISGATLLADSTLLSSEQEPATVESGACVMQSVLQWATSVSTMSIVDRSVLCEHSHAERHGKVTDSIVGPNTGIAEGEATACLLGPFVGFHHQALLIAALWPEGKGNVGYGANAGSNHTSKAPDQEFWPGEGLFLGLGVNIKFPSDFSRSPYSIIATGVKTLPQRISFPFSLINSPSESQAGISPAYNEIIPGWVLTDNIYAVKRNEGKYKSRNKARRATFQFDVFRPSTIDLLLDACQRLESVRDVQPVYKDGEIEGLGKNYLLEKHRRPAIEAYQFYVKYYALLGLFRQVSQALDAGNLTEVQSLLPSRSDDRIWEHQRMLLNERLAVRNVAAGLSELPGMLRKIAGDVEQAKAKDDRRGARIIEDYAAVHGAAAQDKFVVQTQTETDEMIRRLERVLGAL